MRHRLQRLSIIVVFALLPSAAVAADAAAKGNFFEQYFARAQNGAPCYGRTYDDAHLKDHAEQKVRRIEIDMSKANPSTVANTSERFELGLGLLLKSSPEWYGQNAICKANDTSADCYLEGDGGLFKLTPAGGGRLRLQTSDYGIAIEGGKDFMSLSGSEGDDRVFDLALSRDECQAASAFFKSGK